MCSEIHRVYIMVTSVKYHLNSRIQKAKDTKSWAVLYNVVQDCQVEKRFACEEIVNENMLNIHLEHSWPAGKKTEMVYNKIQRFYF